MISNMEELMHFCVANDSAIINNFYQHKDIHKCTRYRDTLKQQSITNLVMVQKYEEDLVPTRP